MLGLITGGQTRMGNKKLILLLIACILSLYVFFSCNRYQRITSVYEYRGEKIYRRDYCGGIKAPWIEFSSSKNFDTGWLIKGNATSGIDSYLEGHIKIDSVGTFFFIREGSLSFDLEDESVSIRQDNIRIPVDSSGNSCAYPSIFVSKDSCIIKYTCYLSWAEDWYKEWANTHKELETMFKFEILDTTNVFVY